jgi:hypothetical protein
LVECRLGKKGLEVRGIRLLLLSANGARSFRLPQPLSPKGQVKDALKNLVDKA